MVTALPSTIRASQTDETMSMAKENGSEKSLAISLK